MLWFLPLTALAAPGELLHQGRLLDSAGDPLTGPHDLAVTLHDAATAGNVEWTHTFDDVSLEAGYFSVVLTGIPDAAFDDALWVSIAVDGGAALARQPLVSVPYAIRASTATSVKGGVVDATEIRIGGTVVIDGTGGLATGPTLGDLPCTDDQVAGFDGGWTCVDASTLGDGDTLGGLSCSAGAVPFRSGGAWTCHALVEPTEAMVDGFVADNGYALDSDLAAVAKSGSWTHLGDVPSGFADGTDDVLSDSEVEAIVGDAGFVRESALADVALSGDYGDLTGLPAYQLGDTLLYAQDGEVHALENNTAYTLMNEVEVPLGGDLAVQWQAYIQSGPDYWAWQVTVNGDPVASGPFTANLFGSTSAVHAYRRYQVELGAVPAGATIGVWMKASDGTGGGFGASGDQQMYMKLFRVYADSASPVGVYGAAYFRGYINNDATIESADEGFARFTTAVNGDVEVFEVVDNGNFGVRILKPGLVWWQYDQDIIATGGNYAQVYGQLGGQKPNYTLVRPTGGLWDGLSNSGVGPASAGDTLVFWFDSNASDITALDNTQWSNLSVMWLGYK